MILEILLMPTILIIILAFGLALSLKNIRLGFYIFILLIPLMHKELFSIYVWDLLPIRIFAIGLLTGSFFKLFKWYIKEEKEKRKIAIKNFIKDPFLIILLLLLLIRVISLYNSQSPEHSVLFIGFYALIVSLYFLFKYLIINHREEFLTKITSLYIFIGFLSGIFAVIQLYARYCCRETIGGVWVIPGYTPRLGSTFWDVNHFGGFLITLIPLSITRFFIEKKIYKKVIYLLLSIFFIWLLFMTQSRSAWLGLAIGMAITAIVFYGNRFKKALLYTALGALGFVLVVTVYITMTGIGIRGKIAQYMHYRLDSTDTHMMLLEGASEIFFNNFLIGAGYGGFDPAFRETETAMDYFDREPKLREMKVPPHSVWGEVLGETGAVGITLYSIFAIILVFSLIYTVYKVEDKNSKYVGIGILGSVISLYSAGIFYSYNMEFFWIMLFIGIGYLYIYNKFKYSLKDVLIWWYQKPITPYLIILPISIFYILLKLGSTTLIDYDEAIYAKVAKNIAQSGEWFSLRWENMEEYWFEKPPLYMWLTAIFFKVTNFSSLGARLTSALFGIGGIILVYNFGKALYNKLTGIVAALILLSTVHYLYYSRNGMLDVTVTFFILLSIYFYYKVLRFWDDNKLKKASMFILLSGVALGFGVMTKAVVGLIPIPIIIIHLIYEYIFRKNRNIKIVHIGYFIAGVLIIALPWHLYSLLTHGEHFWDKYFIDHMWGRGTQGLGHERPLLWFIDVIRVSFRIWIFPFIFGVFALPFLDKKRYREYFLLGISITFVLVFFSISKDKLQWYIMPIYPFMALIAARFIDRFISYANSLIQPDNRLDYRILRVLVIVIIFITSTFYIVLLRDRIYFPDFNKDKVALVKIHNEMFPIEDHPDRRLFFYRIDKPVLLFYSDHKIKPTSEDHMLRAIEDAKPAETNMFLIPESLYYSVRSKGDEIKAPLVLEIKGASGEWMLIKSLSRVEILNARFAIVNQKINKLSEKQFNNTIKPTEEIELNNLQVELEEIVNKLIEYGYSPY